MKSYSKAAEKIIFYSAQTEAKKSGTVNLYPEHVMLAISKEAGCLGYMALRQLGVDIINFQIAMEQCVATLKIICSALADLPHSSRLRKMIDVATAESDIMQNEYIGTEHLLIAALLEEKSACSLFFMKNKITPDSMRAAITQVQSYRNITEFKEYRSWMNNNSNEDKNEGEDETEDKDTKETNDKKVKKSFLSEFSRDLTALAKAGKLDPVIGRKQETDRIIQILSRRTKNNPILIGDPGVGKTSVVEGFAERIAAEDVPYNLLKKRVLLLDMTAMVAGTRYRGDFEERMKQMIKEIKETGDIILFIDELHTIIGAGNPEGGMDAGNILKPALSRGDIQIIGATTFKEYRKHIEKDSALCRRFQIVKVDEPSVADTMHVLEGLRKQYEEYHSVVYDEGVIPAIVKLSMRYIPERLLPDKAIDIMDEAGSAKKISTESRPAELAELEQSIDELSREKESFVENQDYEKAAQIRDKVRDLKRRLDDFNTYWKNNSASVRKHVTVRDIVGIISGMTGIPVGQVGSDDFSRLLEMENEIHKTVIGQNEAVSCLCSTIRRSRAGVSSPNRPIGSFIFLGPTGVGKTQLAKSLARFLFGTESSLVRIDMSDFMEKHTSSRLVGSAPGYVGYENGGVLTNKVLQKPYSIVLFDEIEKAHTDVFNLLLQILEEGELSDNLGHRVNFRNTVIIMTSNAGSRSITADKKLGFASLNGGFLPPEEIRENALEELKKIMAPELINRIDDIVVFSPLVRDEISHILDIQVAELEERLAEKNIHLAIKPKAREYLLDNGYEPSLGARPMRRLIQNEIEDQLATLILSGSIPESGEIEVNSDGTSLSVKPARARKSVARKTEKSCV